MITKFFEIRDRGTFIPAMAFKLFPPDESPESAWLISRAGYGYHPYVFLMCLEALRVNYDIYNWPGDARTFPIAHKYIQENFDSLKSGDVIDVEFILGETTVKKVSEFFEELF